MFNRRKFQAQMVLMGMNMKDLSNNLNINESTLYRKLGNNGDFSREEIGKIIDVLHIDDPMDIFFAESVADTQ